MRIFISSVQKEFQTERAALRDFLQGDALLAEPMYPAKYIERMGTGTRDMMAKCREAHLPEPEFEITDGFVIRMYRKTPKIEQTGEVTGEVWKLILAMQGTMTRREMQDSLALKSEENFRKLYLQPALELGLVEMTLPDKPQSNRQKYRLTSKGRESLAKSGPLENPSR